jgi:hypothetical protein
MIAMNHVAMMFPLQETTPLIQMRENEPQSCQADIATQGQSV